MIPKQKDDFMDHLSSQEPEESLFPVANLSTSKSMYYDVEENKFKVDTTREKRISKIILENRAFKENRDKQFEDLKSLARSFLVSSRNINPDIVNEVSYEKLNCFLEGVESNWLNQYRNELYIDAAKEPGLYGKLK